MQTLSYNHLSETRVRGQLPSLLRKLVIGQQLVVRGMDQPTVAAHGKMVQKRTASVFKTSRDHDKKKNFIVRVTRTA